MIRFALTALSMFGAYIFASGLYPMTPDVPMVALDSMAFSGGSAIVVGIVTWSNIR